MTVGKLVMEYFHTNPDRVITTDEVTGFVIEKYNNMHGRVPRDVGRYVRGLHYEGSIIKLGIGKWKYSLDTQYDVQLFDFTGSVKKQILERDNYRCVFCGRGELDGIILTVDHIKPKSLGGKNTFDNGQTLCYEHNIVKNNYSQYDTGRKYFKRLYDVAKREGDSKMIEFCESIFSVYDVYGYGVSTLENDQAERSSLKKFFRVGE